MPDLTEKNLTFNKYNEARENFKEKANAFAYLPSGENEDILYRAIDVLTESYQLYLSSGPHEIDRNTQ